MVIEIFSSLMWQMHTVLLELSVSFHGEKAFKALFVRKLSKHISYHLSWWESCHSTLCGKAAFIAHLMVGELPLPAQWWERCPYGLFMIHSFKTNHWQQLVSWCFKPSQPQRITSGLHWLWWENCQTILMTIEFYGYCLMKENFERIMLKELALDAMCNKKVSYTHFPWRDWILLAWFIDSGCLMSSQLQT